jgi:YhcH/YjgK/YiaL family protein
MILDRLEEADLYRRLHPGFDAAFDLLRSTPFDEIKPGRHDVMGDSLFIIIEQIEGRGHESVRLEAHRKYIDVQYIIPGSDSPEEFGWRPTPACSKTAAEYDAVKDIIFFADKPDIWLPVPPGYFIVFNPSDAHAPAAGAGPVRKAVVKVAVDW